MPELWSFRPRPVVGELLTSWLARLAIENGTTVAQVIATCTPDTHYPVLDLDMRLPERLLFRLTERAGLPRDTIKGSSLEGLHDLYVGRRKSHGGYRWFMPVHPVRQRFTMRGQQVCPDCLASDPVPHYRRAWRLSFVTTCPEHQCLLLDQCPACAAPIDPRAACDVRAQVHGLDAICRCWRCDADFRHAAWIHLDPEITIQERRQAWGGPRGQAANVKLSIPQEARLMIAANWQARVLNPLEGRWVGLGGMYVEVREYMIGLRNLLRLLTTDAKAEAFRKVVTALSGYPLSPLAKTGRLRFEQSSVEVRHANVLLLTWVVGDWPVRFQRVCSESRIPISGLVLKSGIHRTPNWYEDQCLAIVETRKFTLGRERYERYL